MQKNFSLKTPLYVLAGVLSLTCTARTFAQTGAGAEDKGTAVHERRLLTVNGVQRSYALYVPIEVKANPALVISLHGMYGTIYTFYKDIAGVKTKVEQENSEDEGVYFEPNDRAPFRLATADEAGCIVVYPQGLRRSLLGGQNYGWLADAENTEDIDFFKAIVEDVATRYAIDRKRIYCCGFSNGGMMTYAATTLASDTFAAFASISGYPLNEFHFRATGARPVPFLHIHGKSDDFVKYALWPTIRDMMVARNGCVSVPTVTTDEGRYTKSVYAAGEGGFPYVTYECDGMGHNDGTSRTEDGDSSKTMWNFMSRYTLDDACDKTLKMRMDSTTAERGWTETAAGTGAILSFGTNKQSGDSNVYRSIQLEKGTYTLSLKSNGIVNDRYFVKLVDVTNETHVLLCRSAKIGQDTNFAIAVDAYCQCKLVISKENAADAITEIAIHSGATNALVGAVDYTTLEFAEIEQRVDSTGDTAIEPVIGEGWTGYAATGTLQVAFKMLNVDVKDCEYVCIKFAEPVPESGWWVSFWTGNGWEALNEGATEYVYTPTESDRSSGLPQCTLLTTAWGNYPSRQIKVEGVYKVKAPDGAAEIPSTFVDGGHLKRIANGATFRAETSVQTVWERRDIGVVQCDRLIVKFAGPVGPGWGLAIEGVDGYVRIPEGASGYRLDMDASAVESGFFPRLALVALGPGLPQTVALEGVYRHSLVKGFAIRLG